MKDYYDIYYFLTKLKSEINIDILRKAILNTIKKRNSYNYLIDYQQIIYLIVNDDRILKLWNIYSNKYEYANGIDIKEILMLLKSLIKELNLELVMI